MHPARTQTGMDGKHTTQSLGKITSKFLNRSIFLSLLSTNTIATLNPFLSCGKSSPSKNRHCRFSKTDTHEDTSTSPSINGAFLH